MQTKKKKQSALRLLRRLPIWITASILGVAPVWPQGQDNTLRQALELYRTGRCSEAQPILEALAQQQPQNATIRNLLTQCEQHTAAVPVPSPQPRPANPGPAESAPANTGDPAQTVSSSNASAPSESAAQQNRTFAGTGAEQALEAAIEERDRVQAPPPGPPPLTGEARERAESGGEVERAELLIENGKLEEAALILEAVRRDHPDFLLPRQRLAETYSGLERFLEAAALNAELAEEPEASPVLLLRTAQNYTWDESYGLAVPFYQQYLERRSGDADSRLALADALLWSDRFDESAEVYRQYLTQRTADVDARFRLGQALLWSERHEEALPELVQVANARPGDLEVALAIAQSYEGMQEASRAIEYYERVLAVNPQEARARQARDHLVDLQPLTEARTRVERADYQGAARYFEAYLSSHPGDQDTLLDLARVHSWSEEYPRAEAFYDQYLAANPDDLTALREAAQVELAVPDFTRAQRYYRRILSSPDASVEDYEGMLHSLVWDGELETAAPYAEQLAALDSGNAVAVETLLAVDQYERDQVLLQASTLTSSGRYPEAIEAYQDFAANYGSDQELELTISRLYNWNQQYDEAIQSYSGYVARHPDDIVAQLELADVQKWSGAYDHAERQYLTVLAADANQPDALFGLAQVADYRGDDPFDVYQGYQRALTADAGNLAASFRAAELAPLVSPSVAFNQNSFTDSDGFGRSVSTFEAPFRFRGGVTLAPYASYDYFNQFRQVGGTQCIADPDPDRSAAIGALSDRICAEQGTSKGMGAGLRFTVGARSPVSFSGSVGATRFATNRTNLNARVELQYWPDADHLLTFSITHRNAAYDVNTIAPLYAGITGDNALLSYEQGLSDRWRLWLAAGFGRYSRGIDGTSPLNTQKLFSARADYRLRPEVTVGYFIRATSFTAPSELYFSPKLYGTYGLSYQINKSLSETVSFLLDGQVGHGRINRYDQPGVNVLELVAYPSLKWRVGENLDLRIGYRFGRGRSSAFGSPVYGTGMFDFGVENFFTPQIDTANPARMNLR